MSSPAQSKVPRLESGRFGARISFVSPSTALYLLGKPRARAMGLEPPRRLPPGFDFLSPYAQMDEAGPLTQGGPMIARVDSATVLGLEGHRIEVEVDVSRGLPAFSLVGLPSTVVRESRERVASAVKAFGFDYPTRRITVNLAPADLKKEGAAFDLPIALGLLLASGQISRRRAGRFIVLGELALDGRLRPVRGMLPVALMTRRTRRSGVVVPAGNAEEASIVDGLDVLAFRHLGEAVQWMTGETEAPPPPATGREGGRERDSRSVELELEDVRGQAFAKRALAIAAAGRHHLLMMGPPGSGKTMLGRRLPALLPPLEGREAIEATVIRSVTHGANEGLTRKPPFRAPHHTASDAGIIGGGASLMPGEITLAHNGILFLDELPEFRRNVLESLRQPLEESTIAITRAGRGITYPARFLLVAAMNPCPCGFAFSHHRPCACRPQQVQRYLSRVSGPLLDRIGLFVQIDPVPPQSLDRSSITREEGIDTAALASQVRRAAERQSRRYRAGSEIRRNGDLGPKRIEEECRLLPEARRLLEHAQVSLRLSARSRIQMVRVSRSIADLEGADSIGESHLAEALQYRVPPNLAEAVRK